MICPKCEIKMAEGYIPSCKNILQWIPKDEKMPRTIFKVASNGIKLSNLPFWKIEKTVSYYCKNCNIVITPVENFE